MLLSFYLCQMGYWEKRKRAFGYAIQGILRFFKEEAHAKIHLTLATGVIIAGIIYQLSFMEWVSCLLCIGLVIVSEMFNSALENLIDLVSPNQHRLAGRAKDIGAGAVLIASTISAGIGLWIFVPKILSTLHSIVN
jgi:diacylglycerol kinase (ATP)